MNWEEAYDRELQQVTERIRSNRADYESRTGRSAPISFPADAFRRLKQIGGPSDIAAFSHVHASDLRRSCATFAERACLSVLMRYCSDLEHARRHWPWVAHALSIYQSAPALHAPEKDMTPSQAHALFSSIRTSASSLEHALQALGEAAAIWRNDDGRKGDHLEYLQQLLAQGANLAPSEQVDVEAFTAFAALMNYHEWRGELRGLIEAAKNAQAALSTELLRSSNRSREPGLKRFVADSAAVWRSLTGREARVYKVATRDPPWSKFVIFVQDVTTISGKVQTPSPAMIGSAFRHTLNNHAK